MKRHALHLLLHYFLYLLGDGKHASHFSDEHLHLCYFYYRLLIILTKPASVLFCFSFSICSRSRSFKDARYIGCGYFMKVKWGQFITGLAQETVYDCSSSRLLSL